MFYQGQGPPVVSRGGNFERLSFEETPTHLGHVLKVIVSLLQGSSPVQRLPHACVLAEEGLTVVLNPVHHLGEEEEEEEEEGT